MELNKLTPFEFMHLYLDFPGGSYKNLFDEFGLTLPVNRQVTNMLELRNLFLELYNEKCQGFNRPCPYYIYKDDACYFPCSDKICYKSDLIDFLSSTFKKANLKDIKVSTEFDYPFFPSDIKQFHAYMFEFFHLYPQVWDNQGSNLRIAFANIPPNYEILEASLRVIVIQKFLEHWKKERPIYYQAYQHIMICTNHTIQSKVCYASVPKAMQHFKLVYTHAPEAFDDPYTIEEASKHGYQDIGQFLQDALWDRLKSNKPNFEPAIKELKKRNYVLNLLDHFKYVDFSPPKAKTKEQEDLEMAWKLYKSESERKVLLREKEIEKRYQEKVAKEEKARLDKLSHDLKVKEEELAATKKELIKKEEENKLIGKNPENMNVKKERGNLNLKVQRIRKRKGYSKSKWAQGIILVGSSSESSESDDSASSESEESFPFSNRSFWKSSGAKIREKAKLWDIRLEDFSSSDEEEFSFVLKRGFDGMTKKEEKRDLKPIFNLRLLEIKKEEKNVIKESEKNVTEKEKNVIKEKQDDAKEVLMKKTRLNESEEEEKKKKKEEEDNQIQKISHHVQHEIEHLLFLGISENFELEFKINKCVEDCIFEAVYHDFELFLKEERIKHVEKVEKEKKKEKDDEEMRKKTILTEEKEERKEKEKEEKERANREEKCKDQKEMVKDKKEKDEDDPKFDNQSQANVNPQIQKTEQKEGKDKKASVAQKNQKGDSSITKKVFKKGFLNSSKKIPLPSEKETNDKPKIVREENRPNDSKEDKKEDKKEETIRAIKESQEKQKREKEEEKKSIEQEILILDQTKSEKGFETKDIDEFGDKRSSFYKNPKYKYNFETKMYEFVGPCGSEYDDPDYDDGLAAENVMDLDDDETDEYRPVLSTKLDKIKEFRPYYEQKLKLAFLQHELKKGSPLRNGTERGELRKKVKKESMEFFGMKDYDSNCDDSYHESDQSDYSEESKENYYKEELEHDLKSVIENQNPSIWILMSESKQAIVDIMKFQRPGVKITAKNVFTFIQDKLDQGGEPEELDLAFKQIQDLLNELKNDEWEALERNVGMMTSKQRLKKEYDLRQTLILEHQGVDLSLLITQEDLPWSIQKFLSD